MSILDEIEKQRKAQRLFLVEPSSDIRAFKVPPSERRTLYVSPEVHHFLESDPALAGGHAKRLL